MIVLENFRGEFQTPPRSLRKKERSVGREQLNVAHQQQIDFIFFQKLKLLFSRKKWLLLMIALFHRSPPRSTAQTRLTAKVNERVPFIEQLPVCLDSNQSEESMP